MTGGTDRGPPRLLLVTGMSGAGKSTALDALEDMGWDVVDNLPADLLEPFVHGGGTKRSAPAAVAMDVRSRGFTADSLPQLIRSMEGVEGELLYLDCSGTELVRRYDETRRRHPLAPDRPAEDGIARERELTAPLRSAADSLLDTTDLTPAELRDELRRRFESDSDQPVLTIASFGFARGISRTADLVFDLRFLPNPHWVEELRPLTGEDQGSAPISRRTRHGTRRWAGSSPFSSTGFPATGPLAKVTSPSHSGAPEADIGRLPPPPKWPNGCVDTGLRRTCATATSPPRRATRSNGARGAPRQARARTS